MPTGVYFRTKKWREKMSKTAKKYGFGKWMKGRKLPLETREKQRQANFRRKEKFGYYFTKETLKKLRRKRKAILKHCLKCGKDIYSVPSKERKFCSQSCASSYFRGEIAKHWKGGTGTERHIAMSRLEYKKWRKAIFERDNYTCQRCKKRGKNLNAHHFRNWANYKKLRYDLINGITYCKECHQFIHKAVEKKAK